MVEESQDGVAVINQPAGHLEPGESLLEAVVRETLEETAWQFTPEALTGVYRWVHPRKDRTYLRFCFCGRVHGHSPERELDEGIIAAHWLSREQMLQRSLRSPMVLRSIDDYLAGQRVPLSLCADLLPAED